MPSIAPFGENPFGVRVKPLDYTHPHAPATKTYHGLTIVVDGKIVGRIQNWTPNTTRGGTHIRELSYATFGKPIDYVPGIAEGFTVTCQRVEVWDQELEIALGYPGVWADLTDQDRPFTSDEYWFKGRDVNRVWKYLGSWFQERNEDTYDSGGDAVVRTNPTMAFVTRLLAA
jgi:hypothetical protein